MSAVSVVIPARDAARTLGETLASIAAQSRPALELLVVDDGSRDATAAVAAAAGARVLRPAGSGVSAATNSGVAASRAPLIAFCDADDLWAAEKLERQTALLAAHPEAGMALCHFDCFACPSLDPAARARVAVPAEPRAGWLRSCLLLRREAFERVGPLTVGLQQGDMIDWFDRARGAGIEAVIAPEVLVHRRLHPGSMSFGARGQHRGYIEMARLALARRRAAPER